MDKTKHFLFIDVFGIRFFSESTVCFPRKCINALVLGFHYSISKVIVKLKRYCFSSDSWYPNNFKNIIIIFIIIIVIIIIMVITIIIIIII